MLVNYFWGIAMIPIPLKINKELASTTSSTTKILDNSTSGNNYEFKITRAHVSITSRTILLPIQTCNATSMSMIWCCYKLPHNSNELLRYVTVLTIYYEFETENCGFHFCYIYDIAISFHHHFSFKRSKNNSVKELSYL